MDRALDSVKGVRLSFDDERSARLFALRCNVFRSLDRKENKKIYVDETHTMHGRSVYDTLMVSRKGNTIEITPIRDLANIEDIV
jgi:hypothetical protein